MQTNPLLFFLGIALAVTAQSVEAQKVIATIPVGQSPSGIAVNTVTNKIYVPNYQANTVTVIDGVTLSTATVDVGSAPGAVAVDSATNKIYVLNENAFQNGFVTIIDGATLSTTTVAVGTDPVALAVNKVTNKIYVVNQSPLQQNGSVTIIDGATLSTTAVEVGATPFAIAVNEVTNKIYVAVGGYPGFVTVIDGITLAETNVQAYPGSMAINPVTNKIYVVGFEADIVTVIDGVTLSTTTVAVGFTPVSIAVNSVTNEIYVANENNIPGAVTVIDGATLSTTTVTIPEGPISVTINSETNRVYVAICCLSGSVTAIDGANNSTTTVAVGRSPMFEAVAPANDRIYVVNSGDNTVSVIDGTPPVALQFVPLSPCRIVDTRNPDGAFGGPPIPGNSSREFSLPEGACNIPESAAAYSLNVTVVPQGSLGYLTIWPSGQNQPTVSTMNSLDGRIKANAAIVPAGTGGAVSVYVTNTTNVVLDIDGYFTTPGADTLQFYTLTPCRVADTRNTNGPLGGPYLQGGQERDFPVLSSACSIPASAVAYSTNFTVVPHNGEPLGYLTVWPQGSSQPRVSTLNNLTATIVANAAIVPAGTGGEIATYPDQDTDLVVDIDGYFAPPGRNGLSMYPAVPCRILDTRKGNGAFGGTMQIPVSIEPCGISSLAQAFVLNATVLPQGILGYLTLWADGMPQPMVSTLNAIDAAITSNMAIVPNIDGNTDAFASGTTQLILDISSYFAP
jgi:YVTN family beta-propeller protein